MKTRQVGPINQVWDPLRGRWLTLTPEEQVRQNFIEFLIAQGINPHHIAQEQTLQIGSITRRADIVVYSGARAVMIVECKACNVPLSGAVFEQASQYNITLGVPYLVITNGKSTFCAKIDPTAKSYTFLKEFPHLVE
ncbi:MAG: type I restriction enzyme HsdR N-terminal domain-containing protein [Mucinivorans sp.]